MGKSELAAAVALLLTCGDGEERGEVYGCAADRQQASIVFEVAADMVRMCPALNKRVKILASQKRIVYQSTNSFYQVLSAEAYSKHGFNIHGVVFDELHTQPNRKLFDVMTKGSGDARTQPLYFLITTAGTDTNSICYETHQKAKDIIEGRKIDPTFYPVIYGAEETDDWTDPKVWKKANPSLGITVSIDKVQAACDSAKQNPGEENAFRQLRLNQWVKQAVRWMPMDKWDVGKSIVWFDTSANKKKSQKRTKGGSYINEEEKRIILEILDDLKSTGELKGLDIGIITGYSGQKELLRKSIKATGLDKIASKIDINTLDAFQGRENDIIIYSTVRTRDSIGFQKEKERVNVAFSRAKKLLIVCGDKNFFYNFDDQDNKFVEIIDYISEEEECEIIQCDGGKLFERESNS